jgi:hypothetical protein
MNTQELLKTINPPARWVRRCGITSSGRWRWPLDKDSPPSRCRTILPAA